MNYLDSMLNPGKGERAAVKPPEPQQSIETPPPLTDLGNAERFVAQHSETTRYCHSQGAWYVWDKRRWAKDATAEVMRMAHKTVRSMASELAACRTKLAKKALRSWLTASEANARLNAMLTQATALLPLPVTLDQLDADPWLLNVQNGVVDLRTGKLLPHDSARMLTKLAPVTYDPAARSPLWERFLSEATGGDDDLIAFLQRAVGYTLTGDTREEKLFFVHGPTNSGKSTFLEALKSCLGDYAMTADFETFLARSFVGGPRPDIARLAGARFVVSIEVDEGKKLAEGLVKQITGGDTVSARFLYREEFEFRPQFKLWLAANHAPTVKHDDDAMWRRILKLPFEITVPKEKRDPKLKATLADPAQSGAAILAWAVRGCLDWQAQGLSVPMRVELATEAYRRGQDPLADFLTSYCVLGGNLWTPAGELRRVYEQWCRESGGDLLHGKAWTEVLTAHECTAERRRILGKLHRGWAGIGLVTEDESENEPLDF
jgi:putative DNA primase/helicase